MKARRFGVRPSCWQFEASLSLSGLPPCSLCFPPRSPPSHSLSLHSRPSDFGKVPSHQPPCQQSGARLCQRPPSSGSAFSLPERQARQLECQGTLGTSSALVDQNSNEKHVEHVSVSRAEVALSGRGELARDAHAYRPEQIARPVPEPSLMSDALISSRNCASPERGRASRLPGKSEGAPSSRKEKASRKSAGLRIRSRREGM